MTELPKQYAWLAKEPGPRIITEALKLYGVKETPGSGNNPVIMAWVDEIEAALRARPVNPFKGRLGYTSDAIPWCGLGMAVIAIRAGWTDIVPLTPLWARSWAEFGERADAPSLGDVLVFARNGGGHVGVYVGEDDTTYHVLGCNQSDAVTITRIAKSRLLTARRPEWRVSQPVNVRPIRMSASGAISNNEA